MILVLLDLEILQDQNLLKNLFRKQVKEILTTKEAIPGLNQNLLKEARKTGTKIMVQNLKAGLISPIQAKAARKNLSVCLKEAEKTLIQETSMKEAV